MNSITQTSDEYIFQRALDAEDRKYVMELTTFGLTRLEKEPSMLRKDKLRVNQEMEDITVDNLSIFLQTSSTVSKSQTLVHSMQDNVDNVIHIVPQLLSNTSAFQAQSQRLRTQRVENRMIVNNQMKILEVLELPQLMWKCAKSKLYQESLDLKQYATDLLTRYPNIPILKQIVSQMYLTEKYILHELLLALEGNIQLHQCLKIIGYLQRMNVFENSFLLRKEFLSKRLKYIQSLLPILKVMENATANTNTNTNTNANASIDAQNRQNSLFKDNSDSHDTDGRPHMHAQPQQNNNNGFEITAVDAYEYLSKFLGLYQRHIFSIVTQYRAIFVDDDNNRSNDMSDYNNHDSNDTSNEDSFAQDLLLIWAHERVLFILSRVTQLLPFINVGSFLSSIAHSCDYCGKTLRGIGLDFRGLLPPIFEKQIIALFAENCNAAILQFESSLNSERWLMLAKLGSIRSQNMSIHHRRMQRQRQQRQRLTATKTETETETETDTQAETETGDGNDDEVPLGEHTSLKCDAMTGEINVPQILLQYAPLALLTNGFIRAFNELREFVTYSVMLDCKTILMESIQRTAECITKYSLSSSASAGAATTAATTRGSTLVSTAVNTAANSTTATPTRFNNNKHTTAEKRARAQKLKESELTEVVLDLVKVECEDLLPFLCDLFDLMFERPKNEIEIELLLEYFEEFYQIPTLDLFGNENENENEHEHENDGNGNAHGDEDGVVSVSVLVDQEEDKENQQRLSQRQSPVFNMNDNNAGNNNYNNTLSTINLSDSESSDLLNID